MKCLICSDPTDPSSESKIQDAINPDTWMAILSKLCQYLLIPSQNKEELHTRSQSQSVCSNCLRAFQEVAVILTKVQALETNIKSIVEKLGRSVLTAAANKTPLNQESSDEDDQTISNLFRKPVIKSMSSSSKCQ
jgi:protein-arginine kinase activator protein McsA